MKLTLNDLGIFEKGRKSIVISQTICPTIISNLIHVINTHFYITLLASTTSKADFKCHWQVSIKYMTTLLVIAVPYSMSRGRCISFLLLHIFTVVLYMLPSICSRHAHSRIVILSPSHRVLVCCYDWCLTRVDMLCESSNAAHCVLDQCQCILYI